MQRYDFITICKKTATRKVKMNEIDWFAIHSSDVTFNRKKYESYK